MEQLDEHSMLDEQTRRIVERLAAGLQHEINSPLGALTCAADSMNRIARRCRTALDAGPTGTAPDAAQTAAALSSVDALCAVIDASTRRITEVVRGLEHFGLRGQSDGALGNLDAALRLVEHAGSLRLAATVAPSPPSF